MSPCLPWPRFATWHVLCWIAALAVWPQLSVAAPVATAFSARAASVGEVPAHLMRPDFLADSPPPTHYDLERADVSLMPDNHGLMLQLGRTILALVVVIALIYLFAKLAMPRLFRALPGGGTGQLRVVERLQLDPKHALAWVEVGDGRRILIGTGDAGVQLLGETLAPTRTFHKAIGEQHEQAN